jgi:hypothetical protein
MDKMISEVVRPKNVLTLAQGIFSKNGRKKNYTIKVSIILENNDYVENYKDFTIAIDDWDISFFDHLVKLNDDEIVRFKNSKKFERRV